MPSSSDKWRYTLYTTLVLLILFNPWTYKVVNSAFSIAISNKDGCPTLIGFFVHAIIFTIVVRYMMDIDL